MSSSARPKIPFKGTLLAAVVVSLGLWAAGKKAEAYTTQHGESLAAMGSLEESADVDGLRVPDEAREIEEQLALFMPLAGLPGAPGDPDPSGASHGEEELTDVEKVRAARPPGWVYPAFDEPADGLHGPPATTLPRNVSFQLVGADGKALQVESLEVYEQTVEGPVSMNPYSAALPSNAWHFGAAGLMTGSRAYFRVHATVDSVAMVGTLMLDSLGTSVDVAGGIVTLRSKP